MEIDADLDPHYKIRGSETLLSDLVHLPIVLGGLHLEERVSVHLSAGAGGRVLLLTLFILLPTPLALFLLLLLSREEAVLCSLGVKLKQEQP